MKQKIEELTEFIDKEMASKNRDIDKIIKACEELDQLIILYYKEKYTIKDKKS